MFAKLQSFLLSFGAKRVERATRLPLSAAQLPPTDDAGAQTERAFEAQLFDALLCDGPFEAVWEPASAPSIALRGDSAQLAKFSLSFEGGKALLSAPAFVSRSAVKAIIKSPSICSLESVNGAKLAASGVKADHLAARMEGSGSLFIVGEAPSASYIARGPGELDASQTRSNLISAQASDKARLECFASQSALASADTKGSVTVHGNPGYSEQSMESGGRVKVFGAAKLQRDKPGGGIFDHVPLPRR